MTYPSLQPGDVLLYRGRSLLDWVRRFWYLSPVSHAAVYVANGVLHEARRGTGVWAVPFHEHEADLYAVCRPVGDFDIARGIAYFEQVEGTEMAPGTFVCRWLLAASLEPHHPAFDCGLHPKLFLTSPFFTVVWVCSAEALCS